MKPSAPIPFSLKLLIAAAAMAVGIVIFRETVEWRRKPADVTPAPSPSALVDVQTDTLARVREIIAVHTAGHPELVTPAMPLSDLGIDLLTRLEIADALETAYRIELSAEELSGATTVDDLVRLVVAKRQASVSPPAGE